MAASPGLPRTPPSARRASSNFIGELPADEYLFEAPADLVSEPPEPAADRLSGGISLRATAAPRCAAALPPPLLPLQVCPLTLAPFIDPVLTSAGHVSDRAAAVLDGVADGVAQALAALMFSLPATWPPTRPRPITLCVGTPSQVYERAAIQAHLEHNSTDPLTRTPLLNKCAGCRAAELLPHACLCTQPPASYLLFDNPPLLLLHPSWCLQVPHPCLCAALSGPRVPVSPVEEHLGTLLVSTFGPFVFSTNPPACSCLI